MDMRNRWIPEGVGQIGAALAAGAVLAGEPGCAPEVAGSPDTAEVSPREWNPVFDADSAFLEPVPGGTFSAKEKAERTKTLENGEIIFEDIGLAFYQVQKGDTINEIRARLSQYPRWEYLAHQTGKMYSFNIPEKKLQVGMWLPIPMESKDRHLTDQQFEAYSGDAVDDMQSNLFYGEAVRAMIEASSREEVVAALYAIAKQESGGLPLGQFELHRWEPGHHAFSFSLFHVLMEGCGLKARKNLDLTEGQLYHPQNASKIFLGFLVEKSKERHVAPESLFPLDEHLEEFAALYNGDRWRTTNPDYVDNVRAYYNDGLVFLEKPTGTSPVAKR